MCQYCKMLCVAQAVPKGLKQTSVRLALADWPSGVVKAAVFAGKGRKQQ
jgi:hypothetical protein